MTSIGAYLSLTKPRLMPMVLLSGLPGLILAAEQWPEPNLMFVTLLGTALAAGAANALNSYLERSPDARMERTRMRPLPAGLLAPSRALLFGLVLSLLGTGVLWIGAGWVPAGIALAAILFYVFVYTLWLKPRHPVAVIAGGVSGAVVPLIADAAVRGTVGLPGFLLFLIIFAWQPPHFYAIALYRRREYERAGFPMLLQRRGEQATRRRIVAWAGALIPLTLVPVAVSRLGPLYAVVALTLGLWFLWQAIRLCRERSDVAARSFFRCSLMYLGSLFLAMLLDLLVFGVFP
jgi:protoheme IX farnesyltransferase